MQADAQSFMQPELVPMLLSLAAGALIYLPLPAALLYLALRFVRAQERRAAGAAEVTALAARVAVLEEQVAAVGHVVDQVAEGQRFTTAVLTERTRDAGR